MKNLRTHCSYRTAQTMHRAMIAERAFAIVKGNGYGMVIIEGPDEYELRSLESLLKPHMCGENMLQ
jgi:hypothetical protein